MNHVTQQIKIPKNINISRAAILFALFTASTPTLPIGPSTILRLASAGKLSKLQECHQDGIDLQTIQDRNGETLLHKAIIHENKTVSEWLIDTVGLSANSQDSYGNTPLHTAIRYLKPEAVDWLVHEKNASLHLRGVNNYTPLQTALKIAAKLRQTSEDRAIEDIKTIVDILLKNGDGIYNANRINGALLSSAKMGLSSIMKHLIEYYEADITATSHSGSTVLHRAIRYDKNHIVPVLVERYEADIHVRDRNGQTPLILALQRLHSETLTEKQRKALENTVVYLTTHTDFETEFVNQDERQAVTQAIQAVIHPRRYARALREAHSIQRRLHHIFDSEKIRLPDAIAKLLMSFATSQLPEPRTPQK